MALRRPHTEVACLSVMPSMVRAALQQLVSKVESSTSTEDIEFAL